MRMTNLRTDVELMGEKEVNQWVDSILKNTHKIDIQILHERLESEFEIERLELIHSRIHKICDVCETVYPENYDKCLYQRQIKIDGKIIKCQDKQLRAFKIHNNMKELEKNWKTEPPREYGIWQPLD